MHHARFDCTPASEFFLQPISSATKICEWKGIKRGGDRLEREVRWGGEVRWVTRMAGLFKARDHLNEISAGSRTQAPMLIRWCSLVAPISMYCVHGWALRMQVLRVLKERPTSETERKVTASDEGGRRRTTQRSRTRPKGSTTCLLWIQKNIYTSTVEYNQQRECSLFRGGGA